MNNTKLYENFYYLQFYILNIIPRNIRQIIFNYYHQNLKNTYSSKLEISEEENY